MARGIYGTWCSPVSFFPWFEEEIGRLEEEEEDRRRWVQGVKLRLGLYTTEDRLADQRWARAWATSAWSAGDSL
jgi:hypothetical protein